MTLSWTDSNPGAGGHTYYVSAVDTFFDESAPTGPVDAPMSRASRRRTRVHAHRAAARRDPDDHRARGDAHLDRGVLDDQQGQQRAERRPGHRPHRDRPAGAAASEPRAPHADEPELDRQGVELRPGVQDRGAVTPAGALLPEDGRSGIARQRHALHADPGGRRRGSAGSGRPVHGELSRADRLRRLGNDHGGRRQRREQGERQGPPGLLLQRAHVRSCPRSPSFGATSSWMSTPTAGPSRAGSRPAST